MIVLSMSLWCIMHLAEALKLPAQWDWMMTSIPKEMKCGSVSPKLPLTFPINRMMKLALLPPVSLFPQHGNMRLF